MKFSVLRDIPAFYGLPEPTASVVPGSLAFVGETAVRIWKAAGTGRSPAPTVVACHGWTDGAEIYETLAPWLGGKYSVVAPDAPGHGGTRWTRATRYSFDGYVDGVLSVVDSLDDLLGRHGDVVLLGHSFGALVAARVAARTSTTVAHLIMEEPARRPLMEGYHRRRDFNWVQRLQATDHEGRVTAAKEIVSWDRADLDVWARTKEQLDPAALTVPAEWGEPLVRTMRSVTCPTTIMIGQRHLLNLGVGRTRNVTHSAFGRIRIIRLPSGHSPRRDTPGHFARALLGELGAAPSTGS